MNYRVILIENNKTDLNILKQEMYKRGYEIVDYRESVTRINEYDPELPASSFLLIDITEPFLAGHHFVEKTKYKTTPTKDITILSGFINDEDVDLVTSNGGRVFPKPFDLVSLMDWLENNKDNESPENNISVNESGTG